MKKPTYERARALVCRASGPLASHLDPFIISLIEQQYRASVIYIKARHGLASYRDTFRLLLKFVQKRLRKAPNALSLEDIDVPLVVDFLDELEKVRKITPRTRTFA
jgi:hypothetical protein